MSFHCHWYSLHCTQEDQNESSEIALVLPLAQSNWRKRRVRRNFSRSGHVDGYGSFPVQRGSDVDGDRLVKPAKPSRDAQLLYASR